MRILLAYKANAGGAGDPYTSLLPVGLGYLNAVLRCAGWQSQLANLSQFSWKKIESLLAAERPDLFGISVFTHNRFDSLKLAALAKKLNPSCFVVCGGPHATHRYREILARCRAVDAVVIGEGETTFSELVTCLTAAGGRLDAVKGLAIRAGGKIVLTPHREPLPDLDVLPIPAAFFDNAVGVDIQRQLEFIITSRGCPAACLFCSSPRFWGKGLRFRSPQSIIDEIRFLRDHFGLLYFSIRDDTFTSDRRRVLEFCRLLLQEKIYILWNCQSRVSAVDEEMLCWMKRAGCECVQFGVESGSRKMLRELGKNITVEQIRQAAAAVRRVGINLSVYLITGIPGETDEDLHATLRLVQEIKPNDGQVSPLVYYPGTPLFDAGVSSGAVKRELFETDHSAASLVRADPFVTRSTKAMLAALRNVAGTSAFTVEQFTAQKALLGYCHTTNALAGESYEQQGLWQLAEAEYREIVGQEPENPWGWLMLGELYGRTGMIEGARRAFRKLIRLVPAHAQAYTNLAELERLSGARDEAKKLYLQALQLDPGDRTAKKGLAGLSGKK